jgi:hypothetical protein
MCLHDVVFERRMWEAVKQLCFHRTALGKRQRMHCRGLPVSEHSRRGARKSSLRHGNFNPLIRVGFASSEN